MENTNTNQEEPTAQRGKRNLLFILLAILLTALIVGGGVYLWQKSYSKNLQKEARQAQRKNKELQRKITELQNQMAQLQAQQEVPAGEEEPTKKPGEPERAMGYIKNVYEKNGKRYLDIDYVQWLMWDEAIKAKIEDGECSPDDPDPIPNDFYIRNQNPRIRTFEISKDAKITRIIPFECPTGKKVITISYEEFKNLFTAEDSYFPSTPFNIEVVDGLVTKITEQYVP